MNPNFGALMYGDQQVGQQGQGMIPGGPGQLPGTQVPWPPPQNAYPLLTPPSMSLRAGAGGYWYRDHVPVDRARPWFVADPNVGRQPRQVVKNFTGLTANAESTQTIQCDIPAVVIKITGGSNLTTTGADQGLGTWKARFRSVQGDSLTTELAIASAIIGTGSLPYHLADTGWAVDRGTVISVTVRPLIANLAIDVVLHWIESRGPVNFGV